MFRAILCSSPGGHIVLQHLVSFTLCKRPYSTPVEIGLSIGVPYGHLQRMTIADAVIIQYDLLKMSIVLLETRRGLQCNIYIYIVIE